MAIPHEELIIELRQRQIIEVWGEQGYIDPSWVAEYGEYWHIYAHLRGNFHKVKLGYYYANKHHIDLQKMVGMTGNQAVEWLRVEKEKQEILIDLIQP